MNTATLIEGVENRPGKALYKVEPPMVGEDWEGKKSKHNYVLVSAVNAMFTGPETYIFPARKDGAVTDYGELDGSYRGGLSHARALRNAGYKIVAPTKKSKSKRRG